MQAAGVITKLNRKQVLIQTHACQAPSIHSQHADLKKVVGHDDDTTVDREVVRDFRFRIQERSLQVGGTPPNSDLREVRTQTLATGAYRMARSAVALVPEQTLASLPVPGRLYGFGMTELPHIGSKLPILFRRHARTGHRTARDAVRDNGGKGSIVRRLQQSGNVQSRT